jgi:hypothetical protein
MDAFPDWLITVILEFMGWPDVAKLLFAGGQK